MNSFITFSIWSQFTCLASSLIFSLCSTYTGPTNLLLSSSISFISHVHAFVIRDAYPGDCSNVLIMMWNARALIHCTPVEWESSYVMIFLKAPQLIIKLLNNHCYSLFFPCSILRIPCFQFAWQTLAQQKPKQKTKKRKQPERDPKIFSSLRSFSQFCLHS